MAASPSSIARSAAVVEGQGVRFDPAGGRLAAGLDLTILPGLTWVTGDSGRGKTSLLMLLAGRLAPTQGRWLRRPTDAACLPTPLQPEADAVVTSTWLQARSRERDGWDPRAAEAAIDGLALRPHLDKTLAMLSAGTRRKLGLVQAAASMATLTLLDQPFDALDAPARRWLLDCLRQAAHDPSRAWVVADYVVPPGLDDPASVAVIDLDAPPALRPAGR